MMKRILLCAALAVTAIVGTVERVHGQKPRRIVVIDAGHGGPKSGMRARLPGGAIIDEKTITLGIALKLEAELKKRGVMVVMTRTTDVDVELNERGRIANAHKGDIFLSIHVNAAGPKQPRLARGFETYFFDEAKTEDERRVEAMENEIVRIDMDSSMRMSDPVNLIIKDMVQNEHLRESSELALTIQDIVGGVHPGPNRGVKQANFAVLRTAFMPAVLIETGFGSNPTEAQWLASSGGQKTLAMQIADATIDYLEKYEQRTRSTSER